MACHHVHKATNQVNLHDSRSFALQYRSIREYRMDYRRSGPRRQPMRHGCSDAWCMVVPYLALSNRQSFVVALKFAACSTSVPSPKLKIYRGIKSMRGRTDNEFEAGTRRTVYLTISPAQSKHITKHWYMQLKHYWKPKQQWHETWDTWNMKHKNR